ncbi:MAG TPA: MFS transporter [Caulobacteraceae bacterium]|jgi:MFS family permease|nr:MFS transporter [Caulobacteraceae bacterium]
MTDTTAEDVKPEGKTVSMRTVVAASSAGTAFEWYDFFVFGTLTAVIAKNFFAALDETAGLLAALALFGAGFFFRPIGALIFGHVGDRIGRKGAFLVTVTLMGGATFAIGLLPTYAQAGPIAPILLILMRIIQGTALGGEYGGAAIYVAEHASANKRGGMTGWIQTSASFGLGGALVVIFAAQDLMGKEAFESAGWTGGWRIPFLFSAGLLAISIYMRLKLTESPAFAALKAAGAETKAPYAEAFGQWKNLRIVLLALVAIMSAQGASWYTTFFYADQVFLQRFLQIDSQTGVKLLMLITLASAPLYVFFAWLSDRVGRKWVMWSGMTLALVAFFPAFHAMAPLANPALAEAQARSPVVVIADPARCSLQFDIIGKAKFATSCDIAKSVLSNAGVSYENQPAPAGAPAVVRVGGQTVVSQDAASLSPADIKAATAAVKGRLSAALAQAGYPSKADPARMNFWGLFGIMMIFVVAATALYGPMAAALVEMFPTRVRYTALSLPYHVGTGWIGGFVPVTAFAIVTATGNIYSGLWYPVIFTAISVITLPFLLRETAGKPLT